MNNSAASSFSEVTTQHELVGKRTPSDTKLPWIYCNGGMREPELQYLSETILVWITLEYHLRAGAYCQYKLGEATKPGELWSILQAWMRDPQAELNRIGYTPPTVKEDSTKLSTPELDGLLADLTF